jgi:hypothetical protein
LDVEYTTINTTTPISYQKILAKGIKAGRKLSDGYLDLKIIQLTTMVNRFIAIAGGIFTLTFCSAFVLFENLVMNSQNNNVAGDPPFEVAIDLELARFEGRSHRPFVAVWVENKKKELVRNVALWYNKPRWLHDLRQWFNKNSSGAKSPDGATGATRSPGKYTIKWDGKDNDGNDLKSGKYTLYIEAAREHGTYQIIKQEINLNQKQQHYDLEGGVEITSASIDYHPVAQN